MVTASSAAALTLTGAWYVEMTASFSSGQVSGGRPVQLATKLQATAAAAWLFRSLGTSSSTTTTRRVLLGEDDERVGTWESSAYHKLLFAVLADENAPESGERGSYDADRLLYRCLFWAFVAYAIGFTLRYALIFEAEWRNFDHVEARKRRKMNKLQRASSSLADTFNFSRVKSTVTAAARLPSWLFGDDDNEGEARPVDADVRQPAVVFFPRVEMAVLTISMIPCTLAVVSYGADAHKHGETSAGGIIASVVASMVVVGAIVLNWHASHEIRQRATFVQGGSFKGWHAKDSAHAEFVLRFGAVLSQLRGPRSKPHLNSSIHDQIESRIPRFFIYTVPIALALSFVASIACAVGGAVGASSESRSVGALIACIAFAAEAGILLATQPMQSKLSNVAHMGCAVLLSVGFGLLYSYFQRGDYNETGKANWAMMIQFMGLGLIVMHELYVACNMLWIASKHHHLQKQARKESEEAAVDAEKEEGKMGESEDAVDAEKEEGKMEPIREDVDAEKEEGKMDTIREDVEEEKVVVTSEYAPTNGGGSPSQSSAGMFDPIIAVQEEEAKGENKESTAESRGDAEREAFVVVDNGLMEDMPLKSSPESRASSYQTAPSDNGEDGGGVHVDDAAAVVVHFDPEYDRFVIDMPNIAFPGDEDVGEKESNEKGGAGQQQPPHHGQKREQGGS